MWLVNERLLAHCYSYFGSSGSSVLSTRGAASICTLWSTRKLQTKAISMLAPPFTCLF